MRSESRGRRRRLSTEVDASSAVLAVDPRGIDDQADPWPSDFRGAQVEVSTDEPVPAVPARLDQAVLGGVIPVEQDVDPVPSTRSLPRPFCQPRPSAFQRLDQFPSSDAGAAADGPSQASALSSSADPSQADAASE